MANGDLPPDFGAVGAPAPEPSVSYLPKGGKIPEGFRKWTPGAPAAASTPPEDFGAASASTSAAPAAAAIPAETGPLGDVKEGARKVLSGVSKAAGGAESKVSAAIPQGLKQRYTNIAQTIGVPAEQFYEHYLARPANKAVAMGVEQIQHPEWTLAQGIDHIQRDIHTPYEQMPDSAKWWAENVIVPQDITSAGLDVLQFAMPEIGAERKLGEAAQWYHRLLGNRLGRTATGAVVGGLLGGATGQGVGQGAFQGAVGIGVPELVGRGIESVSRKLGRGSLIRETTAKFGKAITDRIPWVGKLETGDDLKQAFVWGGARDKIGKILADMKNTYEHDFANHLFDVPDVGPNGRIKLDASGNIKTRKMTFRDADNLRTDLQQDRGYVKGDPRYNADARHFQHSALAIRDSVANGMNAIKRGAGDAYRKTLKQYQISEAIGKMFEKTKNLFHEKYGINQPEMIDRMDRYALKLKAAMGEGPAKDLLNVLKRGAVGEGKDLPLKMARNEWLKGFFRRHGAGALVGGALGYLAGYPTEGAMIGGLFGGERFDPAGNVRWTMRPQMDAAEAAVVNAIAGWQRHTKMRPEISPAITSAQKQRAQNVAGPTATPDRVSRIQGHTQAIARGESPNVQTALNRGDLSIGNVRKMLDHSNLRVETAFADLSPQDAIHAFSQATASERQALLPALIQHIQNTGGQMPPAQRQQMLAQLQAAMAADQGTA
jgi:hypothetical protein